MKPRLLAITVALTIVATIAAVKLSAPSANTAAAISPQTTAPRTLLLAVDGLSWEAFQHAKSLGMFARFSSAGRLIAPYPSMSHAGWMEVMGTRRVFGARGNVRTVEAKWFDLEAMRFHDDPREVMARQAGPFNYMRAFDTYFDPLIEPLMYFPGRQLFDRELQETERDILVGFNEQHYAAYVSGSDALAHTHRDSLYSYLRRLDSTLARVIDSLQAIDSTTQVWMVSDHGNAGGFPEGERESYLSPVSMRRAAQRAGLVFRDSGSVTAPNEVAIVTIALSSMINAYFPDLSQRRAFAVEALREKGVSLVTWVEVTARDRFIVLLTRDGEAHLRWSGDSVAYHVLHGNPLEIPTEYWSSNGATRWLSDSLARAITVHGNWPDAPRRLVASAMKQVENAPDLIVNLEDGFCADGDFGRVVRMVRTHGALSARSTFGVLAGTRGSVPEYVRADEAMAVMKLHERDLYHHVVATHFTPPETALQHAIESPRIATSRGDESIDAAFLRRAQPVVQSMHYYTWDRVRDVVALLPKLSSAQGNTRGTIRSLQQADVLEGLTDGVDEILEFGDSLVERGSEMATLEVPASLRNRSGFAPLVSVYDAWVKGKARDSARAPSDALIAARQATMLAWTLPAYLDAALNTPETDSIDDPRDLSFATRWITAERERIHSDPSQLLWNNGVAARLLKEVFAERQVLRQAGRGEMSLFYTPRLADVSVVLLPGIYTELFDDEIWQRGLRSIRDYLGLRALTAPLDGRCSVEFNAAALRAFLHDDTQRRLSRGYSRPRYLLLGYSKGGLDATHMLLTDSIFAHEQVAALVTIASPHGGSVVPERAGLPAIVTEQTSHRPLPSLCRDLPSHASLAPQVRNDFWAGNAAAVGERTRLFSVSFVSTMEDAHPWMKITKRIGMFAEPNDGVVTLSASRFPSMVPAVHLGEFEGDHIAGIRASTFPQEAFLESLIVTLGELGVFDGASSRAALNAQRRWIAQRAGQMWGGFLAAPDLGSNLRDANDLPGGSSGWTATATFRTFDGTMPGAREVAQLTPRMLPGGIDIRCDQRNMLAFRREYEFAYDGSNGGAEGNLDNGFSIVVDNGSVSGRACRFATRGTAIKMTTIAFRFQPMDFPALSFRVKVAENVRGVDPSNAKRGANDAAFKLWFVLNDRRSADGKNTRLFGYTWNAPDATGRVPPDDALLEAVSSRRSLVVKTLPEAWLITIGDSRDTGWQQITRNLATDIARAYPDVPQGALEVVAITIQSDSDASHGRSLAFLDQLAIAPQARVASTTR